MAVAAATSSPPRPPRALKPRRRDAAWTRRQCRSPEAQRFLPPALPPSRGPGAGQARPRQQARLQPPRERRGARGRAAAQGSGYLDDPAGQPGHLVLSGFRLRWVSAPLGLTHYRKKSTLHFLQRHPEGFPMPPGNCSPDKAGEGGGGWEGHRRLSSQLRGPWRQRRRSLQCGRRGLVAAPALARSHSALSRRSRWGRSPFLRCILITRQRGRWGWQEKVWLKVAQ